MDLLAPVKAEIAAIRADVERAVKIALLRETAETVLSRLMTLDADKAAKYSEALKSME